MLKIKKWWNDLKQNLYFNVLIINILSALIVTSALMFGIYILRS